MVLFLMASFLLPYLLSNIGNYITNGFDFTIQGLGYFKSVKYLVSTKFLMQIYFLTESCVLLCILYFYINTSGKISSTELMHITDQIQIPIAVGQGQHGTSRFLTEEEKEEIFELFISSERSTDENLGLVVGKVKKKKEPEKIYCIADDCHSIIIGATRAGKGRNCILQTIWLRGLCGGSMVICDPKGELYSYTHKYLKENGIKTITFDLREPLKGTHFNYMESINLAVKMNDIPKAIDYAWDLVSVLVGVPKGEPLWTNGESAAIAAAILVVALEAPEEYRNLTNVYYFLANMCKTDDYGTMPISAYFKTLPDTHPAKGIFAVAELAPERTRGSFFTSALATLRLFTNWNIADMTSKSEFELKDIAKEPTALFIIVPDEKTTLYPLVSLFINLLYVDLVDLANCHGGRVPVPVDFYLDEFGNLPAIPGFGGMLSVGAGRGLRFTLVLQDYQQLHKAYEKDADNIKGNCAVTIYLRTPTPKTLEELSKRTGTYTVQVSSGSSSGSIKQSNVNYSSNVNMQSRPLLYPDEIGRIERPYSLIFYAGKYPGIFYAPDLSEYRANEDFGMGDKTHNLKLIQRRSSERKERNREELKLWGIWNESIESESDESEENGKRVSFLD